MSILASIMAQVSLKLFDEKVTEIFSSSKTIVAL